MDDIFGSGPDNPYEANYQCKRVVTEANRLGLVQHPDKLKPPVRTNKQSESQDEVRHYGGFVITTSPLSRRGSDATLASARVMEEVILDVHELARRVLLGFFGKIIFLEKTLPKLLHLAIDSVRVILSGEKDPDDKFYDQIVSIPQVGKNCGQRFIKMLDENNIYQSFPRMGTDYTIAFTDASAGGGGFSALRDGQCVERKVTFRNLSSKHSMFTEPLQFEIILNQCCAEHKKTVFN